MLSVLCSIRLSILAADDSDDRLLNTYASSVPDDADDDTDKANVDDGLLLFFLSFKEDGG